MGSDELCIKLTLYDITRNVHIISPDDSKAVCSSEIQTVGIQIGQDSVSFQPCSDPKRAQSQNYDWNKRPCDSSM
jgi:hypothetical protein